jgi:hypothetical protein
MKRLVAALVVVLGFSATSAWANSISFSISITDTVQINRSINTSPFAAFDPALGTLNRILVQLLGTVDYTGFGDPFDEGSDDVLLPDPYPNEVCNFGVNCVNFPAVGNGLPFYLQSVITDASVLAEYTGAGVRDFLVKDTTGDASDQLAFSGTGTVTYDYTPFLEAPPPSKDVPEPPTWLLLGFGLLTAGLKWNPFRQARARNRV